jgi:hypothetical protein
MVIMPRLSPTIAAGMNQIAGMRIFDDAVVVWAKCIRINIQPAGGQLRAIVAQMHHLLEFWRLVWKLPGLGGYGHIAVRLQA